jgi:predicted HicB family RNase H-like nuclease
MKRKPSKLTAAGASGRLTDALAQAQEYAKLAARREPASKVLAVRVPAALHERLSAEAEARGLPLAELARVLLAEGLGLLGAR